VCLAAALAAFGCAGKSGNSAGAATPPTLSSPASDEQMAGLLEHHRYHHHGGVTLFIAMSLDTLGVAPEKRAAVQKIQADLHTRLQPALAADQKLVATLADGVATSNLDTAKIDARVADVVVAAGLVRDASTDALNELHAALSAAERAALVDKVEAHWAVWQRSNAEEADGADADEGQLLVLASDLQLTQDQISKTRANLGGSLKTVQRVDPKEMAAELKKFGEAFRSDAFDAKAFTTESGPNGPDARLAGWGATYLAHFVEAVSPELTADQRTQLAERLRAHAGHDPSAQVTP
jgi:uncharacterized membrane protein